ncbi:Sin-like protein conserved region-domain-containing protein [Daldinia caldariorum]|uniref:Sin-like protein conserved region-domain-containing protein n=1 Tax=Daldinia caldariorum TaxID=326644 RepID=UPI002008D62C|nr:Sin-like protein conserved region-domain-containing protein [Daldinia caldariorum]KAI1469971.1 Sin-like protein conserved region-domain-containing protein [Daldinia caldariorum]
MSEMDIDTEASKPQAAIEIDSETNNNNTTKNEAEADADADADPIIASYDVYANPQLPENRKLLVLQHPNRQGPVRAPYRQISEVRVKNKSGFVEVDVPISYGHADYDREKGLRWGGALARSTAAKNGGSHGLSGGFGVGVPSRGAGAGRGGAAGGATGKRPDDLERELSMLDWTEAVRQDKVLRTQTLGGQFPTEKETNCRWMVGVFKGDQLHLTPVSSLIHLRPQLHHLDAYTEQERLSRPREGMAGPGAAAGSASKDASGSGSATGAGAGAAKAIHMSIKSAGATEGGDLTVDTMIDRLRKVQVEPWSRLKYEDEDSDKAWHMFTNHLVYPSAPNPKSVADIKKGKGKGKEKKETITADGHDNDDDGNDDASKEMFKAQWTEEEFLSHIRGS